MSGGVAEDDALAALLCDKWSRILSVSLALSHSQTYSQTHSQAHTSTQTHTQSHTISPAELHSLRAEWVAVDRLCVYLRDERASTVMGLVRFHVLHALVCRLLADAAQLETERATAKNINSCNNNNNNNTHSNTNSDANSSHSNSNTNTNTNSIINNSDSAKVKSTGTESDTDAAIASRINFLHRQALMLISLSLEQFHDYAPADVLAILQLTCDTDTPSPSRTHNRCSRNHSRKYLIKEDGTHEGEEQNDDDDEEEEQKQEEEEADGRDHPLARLLHPRTRNDEQSAAAVSKRELVFLWLASTPLYSVLNFYFSHHCYNHQSNSNATQTSVSPTLSLQSPRALVAPDHLTPPHSPHTHNSQHIAPHSPSRHRLHDLSLTLASPPPLSCTQAHPHNVSTEEQRVLREQFLQTKKLALDLAVVMTHSALQWDAVAMGFPLYPHSHNAPKKRQARTPTRSHTDPRGEKSTRGRALQGYERQLLLLFLKLCDSFTVSAPSHWPFMPAECFATVCVPSIERESCAVKIRALFTYSHLHHVTAPAGPHTHAQNPQNTHTQRGVESQPAAAVTSTATASTASVQLSRSRSASKSSRSRANSGASSSSLGSSSTLDRIEEAARRHVWRERLTVVQIYQLTYLSLAERERMERRRERQAKREAQNEDDIICGALMDLHIVGADEKTSVTSDDVGSNLENYFAEQSISYRTNATTRTAQSYAKETFNERQEDEREVDEMVSLCESLLRRLATCSQPSNVNNALQRGQKKSSAGSSSTYPSLAHPASLSRDSFALRDKNAAVTYRNATECFLCHQHVRGLVEKYAVFSSPSREREREKELERERELGAEGGSTSTTRRRHHCRVCGETICSACSSSAHSSRRSSQSVLSPSTTTRRSSWATANPNGTPQKSRASSMRRLSLTPTRDTDKQSSSAPHSNKERTCLSCDEVLHSMLLPIVQELKESQAMQQGECDCAYCMNVMTESGMIPLSEALRQWRDGHSDIGDLAQGGVWKEFS